MNDMTASAAGLPQTSDDLLAGLATIDEDIKKTSTSGVPIMRVGKMGNFVYGQEDVEVQPGSLWALNPFTIQHGWACWHTDGEGLLDEMYYPFNQQVPAKSTLPDMGHPWKKAYKVMVQCTNGEDEGQVCEYKTTSIGGQDFFRELVNAIREQGGKDKDNIVPLLDLEVGSYKHPKHGLILVPKLNIEKWISMAGTAAPADDPGDEDEDEPEQQEAAQAEPEKPKGRGRKPAGDADNKTDSKPTGRRRRAV